MKSQHWKQSTAIGVNNMPNCWQPLRAIQRVCRVETNGGDKKGNILDRTVNIYVTPKYPQQFRQRFISHEDRKVLPSARWGLAEHDQIIYGLYKEITSLILEIQQSLD